MADSRFFQKKIPSLSIAKIIEITGCKPFQFENFEQEISDIAILADATANNVSFLHSPRYFPDFLTSKAGFCLASEAMKERQPLGMKLLLHDNPYFAYSVIASAFYTLIQTDFSTSKPIHQSAKIGKNCQISPFSYIGKDVIIGDDCFIAPSAVIMDGCVIGNRCKINANATISFAVIGDECEIFNGVQIGQDGFGYVFYGGRNHKILQLGIVSIGNRVEIGANSCIDRGALGNTKIADDVKIDNLCQIAHNVEIGQGSILAGGTGIAGSAKIGRFVQIGGGCNIAGHISIGDGVKIAGMSGVMRNIEPKSVMAGIPVMPITKWHRTNSILNKMAENKKDQK
jgi:UDP-3-O-[3-hydroxymyristoyl] glucosamine N-acyltransferase